MKLRVVRAAALLAAVALAGPASPASTFDLRVPQVVFNSAPLASYLSGLGLTGIDPSTAQLDAQVWSVASWPSRDMAMVLETVSPGTTIGFYDALSASPTLYPVLPSSLSPGWFCGCHFSPTGMLTVSLFDQNSVFQGQTIIFFPARLNFGFYLQNGNGIFYSQDARNGGRAQILTFADPSYPWTWYQCFQGSAATAGSTFMDAVVQVEVLSPVPARSQSWGAIKARFR